MVSVSLFVVASCLASAAHAALSDGRPHANAPPVPAIPKVLKGVPDGPVTSRNGTEIPPYSTTYYFDQLIDHNDPSKGTFKQRYWHTWEFYEPGGPIILSTPGEGNADGYYGYLTNATINGLIAQQQNGSTIVIEHRFYGLSNPYPDLTVKSLRLHTLQQAIDDLVYFAKTVKLPQPNGDQVGPDKAPWVLIGGSYSGALTSWTMVNKPGIFWAGYSSSGVVEAILNYWRYFEPIRENMPANCSADVQAVIAHVDKTFSGKNQTAIQELKNLFGLGAVKHLDDVAGACAGMFFFFPHPQQYLPVFQRNNLWDWQSLSPSSGPNAQFFQFCDALEVKNGVSASAKGWGLQHALNAWGTYWQTTYYATLCGDSDAETCLGSYDPTQAYYTNTEIDNAWRSWFWIVCNEVGYLQEGAPPGHPSIVTRLVQPPYDLRQCQWMFPEAFKVPPVPNTSRTNIVYKGWNVRLNRLFFANGQRDPWREATVSAETIHVQSTPQQPIFVSDGFHCSDLSKRNANVDPTVAKVQAEALKSFAKWIPQWKANKQYREIEAEVEVIVKKRDDTGVAAKPINVWFRESEVQ